MAIKNVETARKLQEEFTEKFADRMESLRGGKELSLDRLREEKQRRIERTREKLEGVSKDREAALKRLDQDLERQTAKLGELERELAELETRTQDEKPRKSPQRKPTKRAATVRKPKPRGRQGGDG